MAKLNIPYPYYQPYKLMALNLFEYLQLVDFVNNQEFLFYTIIKNKQTLTIDGNVFNHTITELMALLPAGIVMERD